jgi:molybdopterin molybdotransferase
MPGVRESWQTIEQVLEKHAHGIYRSLREPASDAAIASLAKLVPAKLPSDFVQSLEIHDGLNDSYLGQIRLFNYHALLPVSAVIEEYTTLCALQSESEFGGSQAGGDPAVRNDARWRPGWIPITDADGDKLVLDLDPAPAGASGQVFGWSNSGSTPLRLLASSYAEWLAGLAESLANRRFQLDAHGGIWLDAENAQL